MWKCKECKMDMKKEEEFVRDLGEPTGFVKKICSHIILAIECNLEAKIDDKKSNAREMGEKLHSLTKDELLE